MLTTAHPRRVSARALVSAPALGAICAAIVALSAAPAAGATRYVNAGGDLQAALNAAQPGDQIVLQAGARFTGNFQLPVKPSGPAITIRSSATLPDRRVTASDAPLMPIVCSGNTVSALAGTGTANWVIDGVQFLPNVDGYGDVINLQDVSNIRLDRILIRVSDGQQQKRAIRGNGRNVTLTRSHISGVWRSGQDSQAFGAWDGAGPYTITDNYLEAASENVLFGGANSKSAERVPSDILVEHNHFSKPLAWKGQPRNVKNLIELKQARRAVIRNNLFERNWTDGQSGYAIVFKAMNDEGGSPWAVVEDVLFERNIVRDVERGFNILGHDSYSPSGRASRITIRHNLVLTSGEFLQVGGEAGEVTIDHNTVSNGWTFAKLYYGDVWVAGTNSRRPAQYAVESLTVTNTLAYHRDYGVWGEGAGMGTSALTQLTRGFTWTHNVLAGESGWGKTYPSTTWQPSLAEHEANFNADYSLVSTSVYRSAATDGLDLGAVTGSGVPTAPDPPPQEECGDGVDNDGDGSADEGCAPPPQEVCGDGVDNDSDGSADEGCAPPPQEVCGDGVDNDGDTQVDEGCVVVPADTTGPTVTLWNWSESRNHIKFRVEASDPSGIASVGVEFNGTLVTESTSSTVNVTIPLARMDDRSGEVKVTVTDTLGNVAVTSRTVQANTSSGRRK